MESDRAHSPTSARSQHERVSTRAQILVLAGAGLLIGIVAILAVAALDTASGRVTGVTENDSSSIDAAELDLRIDGPQRLLFDIDGLYPGLMIQRCLQITYRGSIDNVDIRSFARRSGAGGLEEFIHTSIEIGSGADPGCADHAASATVFDGTLAELSAQHADYQSGIGIIGRAADGATTTLRVTAEVVDDNAAQGLAADFWLTIEARP